MTQLSKAIHLITQCMLCEHLTLCRDHAYLGADSVRHYTCMSVGVLVCDRELVIECSLISVCSLHSNGIMNYPSSKKEELH